jgi:hypothetical protein
MNAGMRGWFFGKPACSICDSNSSVWGKSPLAKRWEKRSMMLGAKLSAFPISRAALRPR